MTQEQKEILPTKESLDPRELAKKELYQIWFDYWRGGQTPQEAEDRIAKIQRLYARLENKFPKLVSYLQELTDEYTPGRILTRAQGIQESARAAAFELRKKTDMQLKSEGARRNIRRQKAFERRGTKPEDIR